MSCCEDNRLESGVAKTTARPIIHPFARAVAVLALVLTLCVTGYRLAVSIPRQSGLIFVSGIWTAQAMDLADGVFYRPLLSDIGYGGTRYMPLHFVIQAGLIKVFGHPIASGYAITFLCGTALCGGIYVLLRRLLAPAALAVCFAFFWLSTASAQQAVTTIRTDLLAAALAVWGLAFCMGNAALPRSRGGVWVAALFFVLAFTAKVTSIYAPIAGVASLVYMGRRRDAGVLAGLSLAGMALALAAIHVLSRGAWLESLIACGTGGTIPLHRIPGAPLKLIKCANSHDPLALAMWGLAIFAAVGLRRQEVGRPIAAMFIAAAVFVSAIFISYGIDYNHLIDLNVIALVVVAVYVSRNLPWVNAATLLVAITVTCSSGRTLVRNWKSDHEPARADLVNAAEYSKALGGQMLADNPLVPIYAGSRPFVLDPFALRFASDKRPWLRADLLARIERKAFGSVVLEFDPLSARGKRVYGESRFCDGFLDAVLANYEVYHHAGRYWIYAPRPVP